MKIIIYAIISLALAGCYQRTDQYDIQRAISYCGSVEKILEITSDFVGNESARCMDKPDKSLYGIWKGE